MKSSLSFFLLVLGVVFPAICSANDTSVFGTHWARFQPIQKEGSLTGCQITFVAAIADHTYLNGDEIIANGSIVLQGGSNGLTFALKLGRENATAGTSFEPPAFAYTQTPNASTAKVKQKAFSSGNGYKVFVYNALDSAVMQTLEDMLALKSITIGYNRHAGGMDVLLPLDLTVVDSEYTKQQEVIRKISSGTLDGFAQCAGTIMDAELKRFSPK